MFGPFERAVAGRYLRARRGERFVSVIASFSLIGIALGVATLIVVTSVMSGFQTELVARFLGVNGDITIAAFAGRLRESVDLPSMQNELAATVDQAFEPVHVTVWLAGQQP